MPLKSGAPFFVRPLRQNSLHHSERHGDSGKGLVETLKGIGQALVLEAQKVKNRRLEILSGNLPLFAL